jgi:hypothetical protein
VRGPARGHVACLLVLILLPACGGSAEPPEREAVPPAAVAQEFRTEAGRALEDAAVPDAAWRQLSYGLDPPPALVRRYGIFSVYVVESGNEEAVESLLRDKSTGRPLDADERGIRWERDSQSGTWVAYTRYGENVVLAWFSGRRAPAVDARWERLDRILSDVAARTA